jgi:preprotein translocase subunit SecG
MIISPLLAVSLIMKVIAVLFVLCSIILILVILIQKGKGGGLNAALGGAMASGILGSKTGDFLTWVTIALVGVFLGIAVLMAKFYKPTVSEFGTEQTSQQRLPAESTPPASTDANEIQTPDTNEKTTNTYNSTDANEAANANTTGG